MQNQRDNGWNIDICDPMTGRSGKPRNNGLTMVIDKGVGVQRLSDLIKIAGRYIDFIKFSFGTSFVLPDYILEEKIKLVNEYGIDVYPGGTLFEVAVSQNKLNEFLFRAKQLGFTAIEVSNGTLDIEGKLRREAIKKASSLGFKVLSEVGKKDRDNPLTLSEMITQIKADMESGADKIIVEGRESGRGISIYKDDGSIDMKMFEAILNAVQGKEDILIWEAPLKKQQVIFIKELGPNVNFGNINPEEVISLETLRRGLRGDTLGFVQQTKKAILGA